jgi:hypothetical protein
VVGFSQSLVEPGVVVHDTEEKVEKVEPRPLLTVPIWPCLTNEKPPDLHAAVVIRETTGTKYDVETT